MFNAASVMLYLFSSSILAQSAKLRHEEKKTEDKAHIIFMIRIILFINFFFFYGYN